MRRTFSVLWIALLLLAIMSCTGGSNAVIPRGQNQTPPWDIPWEYYGLVSFDTELRTMSEGSSDWAKTWGGNSIDTGYGVAVDGSGNAYAIGYFHETADFDPGSGVDNHTSNGSMDVFLSKFDSSGAFLWAKTWGGSDYDVINGVAVDESGNVYVTGAFEGTVDFDPGSGVDNHTSNGKYDIFLSKFDSTGDFLWARTWGGSLYDWGHGVAMDASGNAYVIGIFSLTADFDPSSGVDNHTSNGMYDIFLSKFDSSGAFLWAKTWGGSSGDFNWWGVAVDSSDNVYVTGAFQEIVDFDPGDGEDWQVSKGAVDVFLSKFDSSGAFLWAKTWGSIFTDFGNGITVDGSGSVYVTGYFEEIVDFDPSASEDFHTSADSSIDVFLSKFDSSGAFLWARTWGGSDFDDGYSVAADAAGNVYATGYFMDTIDFDPDPIDEDWHTSNGIMDVFLSKFDSTGTFLWAKTWGGSDFDEGHSIAVDGADNIYLTGIFQGTVDFDPGDGEDSHTSNGEGDVFLTKFL